jgi:hypothetical protein
MPHINRREIEGALSDDQTWSYEVGSFCSGPSPNVVLQTLPKGSFATTQWQEERRAITTEAAVKEVLAGAPASA